MLNMMNKIYKITKLTNQSVRVTYTDYWWHNLCLSTYFYLGYTTTIIKVITMAY